MSVTRGLDRDLADKRVNTYDKKLEGEIRRWIESVTGVRTSGSFHAYLHNGVVLCQFVILSFGFVLFFCAYYSHVCAVL